MTKIAIPIISPEDISSKIHEHFGKCDYFAILEVDGDKIVSINYLQDTETKRSRIRGKLIIDNKVEIVIANDVGPHITVDLLNNDIKLFKWAKGTIQDALDDYNAGKLKEVYDLDDLY